MQYILMKYHEYNIFTSRVQKLMEKWTMTKKGRQLESLWPSLNLKVPNLQKWLIIRYII